MRLYNCIFLQSSEAAKAAADDLLAKADAAKSALDGKSPDEILHTLMEAAIRFGLKLLAALAIFIIGAWLIKAIRKRVHKSLLQRKGHDTTLITFTDSFVGMILWILLIAISIGALGINTTSIAALLAAGGMAIGMALSGTLQ
ncbi:MAG: mechanosensitive ion channel family protein, partial [Bacteroidales bacterium]|nr:mechanosensitive ion channel family protein [Bacteroidales bacterium]